MRFPDAFEARRLVEIRKVAELLEEKMMDNLTFILCPKFFIQERAKRTPPQCLLSRLKSQH